jgi:hypothetical protein
MKSKFDEENGKTHTSIMLLERHFNSSRKTSTTPPQRESSWAHFT